MEAADRVLELFQASIDAKRQSAEALAQPVAHAAAGIVECLANGGKVLACGNGGSAGDAQHFASELVNHFEAERAALPAVAITTDASTMTSIANDYGYEQVFARQLQALGRVGDVLLAITTSGNSRNVLAAMDVAHARGMRVVLLTGRDGGAAARALVDGDVLVCVPSSSTARTQEVHLLVIHCMCDLVERAIASTEGSIDP